MLAPCCSFRGNPATLYLLAMGFGQLALDLYAPKGPIEAGAFAQALRAAVAQYRSDLREAVQGTNTPADEPLSAYEIQIPDVGWRFPLEKAARTIGAAAAWHEKVAALGFGVHPWF